MAPTIHTVGDPLALALAGNGAGSGDYVVRIGDEGGPADVVWLDGAADGATEAPARVIAPAGEALWRRAPWPVRDGVFDLQVAADGPVLVVGEGEHRDEISRHLDKATDAPRLTLSALAGARVVVFAQAEGEPLPAPAFAVLAARRVLVLRNPTVRFGLQPGVNHLAARTSAGMAQLANAALLHWDELTAVRAFGRVAAEAHRASTVYARLAFDLAADAGG